MELAAHLGGMTVDELLVRMSDDELDLWAAYSKRHGFARHRQERYLAQIAFMSSDTSKHKLDDFMLQTTQVDDVLRSSARSVAPMMSEMAGGRVLHVVVDRLPGQD